ncbi:uncharacterized protein [Panulirus ornatus]|uniref:uncharacterized protein n=1 Tax=Panulirus ornatus TaxID=150431 RepID=UPI003A88FD0A
MLSEQTIPCGSCNTLVFGQAHSPVYCPFFLCDHFASPSTGKLHKEARRSKGEMSDYWSGMNGRLYGSTGELYSQRVTGKPPIHSKYKMRQQFAGSRDDLDRLRGVEQTGPWRAPTRPLSKQRFSGSLGNLEVAEDVGKQYSTLSQSSSRYRTPEIAGETRKLYLDEEQSSSATQNVQKQTYGSSPRWQTSQSVDEQTLSSRPENMKPHTGQQYTQHPSFLSELRKFERLAELHRAQPTEEQPSPVAGRKANERLYRSAQEVNRLSYIEQEPRAPSSRANLQDWLYGKTEDHHRHTETQRPSYTNILTHDRNSGQGKAFTPTQKNLDPTRRSTDFQTPREVEDNSTRERPSLPPSTQQDKHNHMVADVHVARPVYISDSPASSPRLDDGALPPVHQEEAPEAGRMARPVLVLEHNGGGRPPPLGDSGGGRPPTLDDNRDGRPRTLGDNLEGRPRTLCDGGGGRPPTLGDNRDGRPPTLNDNGGGRPPTLGDNRVGRPRTLDDNRDGRPRTLDNLEGRPRTLDDNMDGRPRTLDDNLEGRPRTLDDNLEGRPRTLSHNMEGRPRTLDDNLEGRPRTLASHRESGRSDQRVREVVYAREEEEVRGGGGSQVKKNISSLRSEVRRIIEAKQQIQSNLIRSQDALKQQVKDLKGRMEEQERLWAEERANKEGAILSQKTQIDRMARELKKLGTPPHPSHVEDTLRKQVKDLTIRMAEQERQWEEERANMEGAILSQKTQIDRMARELKDSGYRSNPSNVEAKLKEQIQELAEKLEREQHLHGRMRASLEAEVSSLKLQLEEKKREMGQRRFGTSSSTTTKTFSSVLPQPGNTSYINSIIQCLFNINTLRVYFIQGEYKKDLNRASPQRGHVAMSVAEVFRAIDTGARIYDAMSNFKRVVESNERVFQLKPHPRAHDLLSCLLTWLHNDLTKEQDRRQQELQVDGKIPSVISCLFHGLMESVIYCPRSGRVVSRARELFDTLSLAVHGDQTPSLQEVLNDHFQPREVDEWACQHCGRPHTCVHAQKFLSLPRLLAIHFYRYSGGGRSNLSNDSKTHVMFPPITLSLHQHVVNRDKEYPSYELVSVCSDKGTTTMSHYIALCRDNFSDRWWVLDDTDVRTTKTHHLQTERDATLVFYTSSMTPSVTS